MVVSIFVYVSILAIIICVFRYQAMNGLSGHAENLLATGVGLHRENVKTAIWTFVGGVLFGIAAWFVSHSLTAAVLSLLAYASVMVPHLAAQERRLRLQDAVVASSGLGDDEPLYVPGDWRS